MKQSVLRRHDAALRAAAGRPDPQPVMPRIFDHGFRPAAYDPTAWDADMLCPKPVEEHVVAQLEAAKARADEPPPPELRALHEITQTGEVFEHGGHTYLLARISDRTYEALCCAGAYREDYEPEDDAEAHADDDLEHDGDELEDAV